MAALSRVSTGVPNFSPPWLPMACIACLANKIIFGIFTLALIPLIAENTVQFYSLFAEILVFEPRETVRTLP